MKPNLTKLRISTYEENEGRNDPSPEKSHMKSNFIPHDFMDAEHDDNSDKSVQNEDSVQRLGLPKINILQQVNSSFQLNNSMQKHPSSIKFTNSSNIHSNKQDDQALQQSLHHLNSPPKTHSNANNQPSPDLSYQQITPGYTKYIIEENNAQYDYVKGIFGEEEIKDAFNVLDMNKDGAITSDDLMFFLDFIGEKATQEEVEEMIRLCDLDGSGEVKYEEFWKMAGGWSLTPLGQAYPPTKELVERRSLLNNLMMEKDIQSTLKGTMNIDTNIKKTDSNMISPRFGANEDQMIQSSLNAGNQINKISQRQVVGTNLKVVRSEEGQITHQNKQQSSLSQKEIMIQRKLNSLKYAREHSLTLVTIQNMLKEIQQLETHIITFCDYESFVKLFQLNDNHQTKLLFNALNEQPLREEYVKNSDHIIADSRINLKDALLTLLGLTEIRKQDKLELAYQSNAFPLSYSCKVEDLRANGYITFDELIKLLVYLYCIHDSTNIEQKISKITQKKGLKTKKDIITKETFNNMIQEYAQVFEST